MGAHLFWKLLPDVQPEERDKFLFFAALLTLIVAGQTAGLAGSEALFLARVGVAQLPHGIVAAAGTTVLGSILYAMRVGSARNDTLFWQMLLLAAGLLLVGTRLTATDAVPVYWALFCAWFLTTAVFLNHFWTFSGDYFDTLQSKRLVPYLTLGTSVGGVLGGAVATALAERLGSQGVLTAWAVALLLAAALLMALRRRLRRWGPLELDEADETSFEAMRGAIRFARSSPLAGWLVVSSVAMALAGFIAQYLYSGIFVARYPDPDDLTRFLSVYLTLTNVIEIAVGVTLTPWLIRRFGVRGANMIHPVLLLAAFSGLAWSGGVMAGIAARAANTRELADNALAAPVRSLMHNAIPTRFRGRVRAFLEGIVAYAGMGLAGIAVLGFPDPDPGLLGAVGVGAAAFYLFASVRARGPYLTTLLEQLATGRLDVDDVDDAVGSWGAAHIIELWNDALPRDDGRPTSALLPLIPILAARGITDPLVRAASHPNVAVRRACVAALAELAKAELVGTLALALDDPDAQVRLAALRGIATSREPGDFVRSRADDLLGDADPRVRAEASLLTGAAGRDALLAQLESPAPEEATAALAIAPVGMVAAVLRCTDHPQPAIRAAALDRVADLVESPPFGDERLVALLTDEHPGVRRAAVRVTARTGRPEALSLLGARLSDADRAVRVETQEVLAGLGELGIAVAETRLRDDSERPVDAALRVIADSDARSRNGYLRQELRHRARQAWWYLLAQETLPQDDSPAARLLLAAVRDGIVRERRLAFRVLRLVETESVVRKVERELHPGSAARSQALEFLSNLGDLEGAGLLAALHLPGTALQRAPKSVLDARPPKDPLALLAELRERDHVWVRRAARALAPRDRDPDPQEATMQRLLALRQIDLFANLSFEQLDAILRACKDVEYMPGEVIIREGERGDTLYLLLEGSVEFVLGLGTPHEERRQPMDAVGYFGEISILANEPRAATAMALEPCQLLTLEGGALRELIRQVPEISFEIFRVFARRLRTAEQAQRAH